MRFYTKIFKAKVISSVFIIAWLLILLLITINHTLSCVDTYGCLKNACAGDKSKPSTMRSSYRKLIEKNCIKK